MTDSATLGLVGRVCGGATRRRWIGIVAVSTLGAVARDRVRALKERLAL